MTTQAQAPFRFIDYSSLLDTMIFHAIAAHGGLTTSELAQVFALDPVDLHERIQVFLDHHLIQGGDKRGGEVVWVAGAARFAHLLKGGGAVEANPSGPPDTTAPPPPVTNVVRLQPRESTVDSTLVEQAPAVVTTSAPPVLEPQPAGSTTMPADTTGLPDVYVEAQKVPDAAALAAVGFHQQDAKTFARTDSVPLPLMGQAAAAAAVKVEEPPTTPFFDLEKGKYNARDVLGMCRVYPLLIEDVERAKVLQVYEVDRQMAELALQMTRCGIPIDQKERHRVHGHLKRLCDGAIEKLRPLTETPPPPGGFPGGVAKDRYREDFIQMVAEYYAATIRKDDPKPGDLHNDVVLSPEAAYMMRVETRKEEFRKKVYKEGVNFNAKVQQAAMLRVAGVPLVRVTPKTQMPQIDKDVLEELRHHEAARTMLDYTLAQAAVSMVESIEVDPDGRLRIEWLVHKITGRWGSTPNVQNWSKRAGGGAENLRSMVVAPPGYKIVGADFAQLEARIIAAMSQDPFLLDIFARNADIHAEFAAIGFPGEFPKAQEIFLRHKKDGGCAPIIDGRAVKDSKCDFCKLRNKLRDLTKRLEYGAFYEGSDITLWESVRKDHPDLQLATVQAFLRAVNEKMPGVRRFQREFLDQALRDGMLRSPILGRMQLLPLGRVEPSVAANWPNQSGAADLWDLGAIEFCRRWPQNDNAGHNVRIFHNGHDSMLVLCPEEMADVVAKDMEESWSREWNGVRFPVEPAIDDSWAEVG